MGCWIRKTFGLTVHKHLFMVSWGREYESRFFNLFESSALFPCAICRGTAFPGVDAESVESEKQYFSVCTTSCHWGHCDCLCFVMGAEQVLFCFCVPGFSSAGHLGTWAEKLCWFPDCFQTGSMSLLILSKPTLIELDMEMSTSLLQTRAAYGAFWCCVCTQIC